MCSAAALANANVVRASMFSLQGATWPSRHWPSGHLHPELGRLEVAWAIRLRWNQVWGWIFCDLWQSCLSVLVFPGMHACLCGEGADAKALAAVRVVSTGSIGWTGLESLDRRPHLIVSLAVHSGFAVQPLCGCDVIRGFGLTSSARPYRTPAFRRRRSCLADTTQGS